MNKKLGKGLLGVAAVILVAQGMLAGESMTDSRRQMQESLNKISSPLFTERMKGLRMFTMMLDPQLLKEFQVIEKVAKIANDRLENPNVRVEALNTLVVIKNNGIEVSKLIELFDTIIKDERSRYQKDMRGSAVGANPRVLIAALTLLPNIVPSQPVGAPPSVERDRVMVTLKDLYANKKNLPQSVSLALVNAFGNFGDMDSAQKVLVEIVNASDSSLEMRTAALRAIRNSVVALGKGDKAMVTAFELKLAQAKDPKQVEIRILILECLESILAKLPEKQRTSFTVRSTTREIAQTMLTKGNDAEVIAAVQFLIRISGKDTTVVENLLKVASPDPKREPPLSYKSLEIINAGLVNVLYMLGGDKKNAPRVTKVVDHMLALLDPNQSGVPEEIKETMILGLGIIPPAFSRTKAAKCLLELLAVEARKEAPLPGRIRQIEDALASLTDVVPFQIVKYEQLVGDDGTVRMTKKSLPDLKAWETWMTKNAAKKLEPRGGK